jgi:hypothetical protein
MPKSAEWYIQKGVERIGPVSSSELKKMAAAGDISPETHIWKESLGDWTPAKAFRGLFSSHAAQRDIPRMPPHKTGGNNSAKSTEIAKFPTLPLDGLVKYAAQSCPPYLPARIGRTLSMLGIGTVWIAALLTVIVGLILAIKMEQFSVLGIFTGYAVGMLVLQYIASKFINNNDVAIRSQPCYLSSYAVPESVFILAVFVTIGASLTLFWMSISLQDIFLGITSLVVLGGGFIVSTAAIHPAELQVFEKTDCQPSEDAIGFFTFSVKLLLRCSAALFACAVIVGTCGLFVQAYNIYTASARFDIMVLSYIATATIVLIAVAIPFYVYLFSIGYFLSLAVLNAILCIPARLDNLAEQTT